MDNKHLALAEYMSSWRFTRHQALELMAAPFEVGIYDTEAGAILKRVQTWNMDAVHGLVHDLTWLRYRDRPELSIYIIDLSTQVESGAHRYDYQDAWQQAVDSWFQKQPEPAINQEDK